MSTNTKEVVSIADLFDLNIPKSITIERNVKPSLFVPKSNPGYRFRQDLLSDVLAWMKLTDQTNDGLYLTGPTGSGKSSIICEVFARLNMPLQQTTGHARLEMPELVGHHVVIDGDTIWQDGPLTTAMRYGHGFLIDEMDLLDPSTAAGLNSIIEGRPLVIAENGGELVKPHPDFRFIATGNTAGGGDSTGLYQGTLQQNAAFMDRMMVIEVGYADPDIEEEILKEALPNLPASIRTSMIQVANDIRDLFMGENGNAGAIEVTMSTRTLLRWGHLLVFFSGKSAQGVSPSGYALDRALCNRATPETRRAIHEIVQRYLA